MKAYLSKLRKDYSMMELHEKEVNPDPFKQFEAWLIDVANAELPEPNAMVLSSVDQHNRPHSRIVLLRNFDHNGFVFYTNYNSDKAAEMDANPHVALNFFWVGLERQVRIEGLAGKLSLLESEEYFQSRPRANQISAWASPQSKPVKSREDLERVILEFEMKFSREDAIPKPPFWGGYRVVPQVMEFWQGRPNRLHDRIRYSLDDKLWKIERLGP